MDKKALDFRKSISATRKMPPLKTHLPSSEEINKRIEKNLEVTEKIVQEGRARVKKENWIIGGDSR